MSLVAISDLFNFEKGKLQSSKCVAGEYNFLTASAEWKTHNEYACDGEALVFAAAASGSLGRTHYVNGKFIASDLCFIITPKDEKTYPIDLQFYHILFNDLKKDIVKNTKAGTSKEAIGLKSFGRYKLPYFELEQQRQIKSKFIESNDLKNDLIIEQETQLTHLKLLRQQILTDAMQGKLDVPRAVGERGADLLSRIQAEKAKTVKKAKPLSEIKADDIPFDIPEHWTWCRLGDIFKFIDYRGKTPVRTDTGVRLISAKNIKMGYIDNNPIEYIDENHYDSWMVRGFPKNGDLLFVTEGHTMGFVAQIDLDFKYILAQRTICLQPYSYDYSSFTKYLIMSEPIQRKIKSMATGAAATGVKSSKLKELVIPLPPLSEQIAIVSKIESLMALCNKLEVNIRQNQEYTQMLYQTALREALQQPA